MNKSLIVFCICIALFLSLKTYIGLISVLASLSVLLLLTKE